MHLNVLHDRRTVFDTREISKISKPLSRDRYLIVVTGVSHVVNSGVSHVVNSQLFNTDFNIIYTDFNIALAITQPTVVSGYFYSRLSIFLYCCRFAASALFTSGLE